MTIVAGSYHLLADCDATMHYFSGIDIFRGNGYNGWASHFWPPLYPVLLGLLAQVRPGFEVSRLISVVAAALLLLVVYQFVYRLAVNRLVACLAQLLVVTNFMFLQLSVQVENHMLDTLFYLLAILLLLRYLEKGNGYQFFLTGLVCGLAGLSRYTSYSLLPAFMLTVFCFYPFRRAAGYAGCILLGFVLVSCPWWWVNYLRNGSPFATWQYMNIGLGVFSNSETRWSWSWSAINQFNSVWEIFLQAPGKYIVNFLYNVVKSFALIVYRGQVTGALCAAAILLYLARNYSSNLLVLRTRRVLPLLIAFACYLLLVCQAFVFSEVFFSWLLLLIIYGTVAGTRLLPVFYQFRSAPKRTLKIIILLAVCFDLTYASWQLRVYLHNDRGIEDNAQIMAVLKQHDHNLGEKLLMCYHPGRAYHLGSEFLMLPLYYNGDLNGLVTYKGLSCKAKEQAPRFPCNIDANNVKANYLVYDPVAATCLPQFSFLMQPGDPRIPRNFQLIYLSADAAVYKIN
jgi:4-amino-4-deoxy-L-arabinose transferase-like glycosyltransferase